MSDSKEVFRLRKTGQIDEAYTMAKADMASPGADDWNVRALSWCLIDLIKRAANQSDQTEIAQLAAELDQLSPPEDEVLEEQRRFALSLADSGRHDIVTAQRHSKAKRHREASQIYLSLLSRGALYPGDHPRFGWDLYYWTKEILSGREKTGPAGIGQARRNLNTYMKLEVDRPSALHSCMLRIAWQLASDNHLNLPAFLHLWNLENFLPDDYDRFRTDDGKTLPALAEKVVQKAAKDAAAGGDSRAMQHLMPHLQAMMKRYPDNVWFRQSLVKFLAGLGQHTEAREQAVLFAREKSREFWAWDLLGDLQEISELRLACYCKGLMCPSEESFVGRLRLKLARELKEAEHFAEARGEIEAVVAHRKKTGYRIPKEAEELMTDPWYAGATGTTPNKTFYAQLAKKAHELLFSDLEWIDACAGESFTLGEDDRRRRWRIYIPDKPIPREISASELVLGLKELDLGQPIRIKADCGTDTSDRVKLYAAELRNAGAPFDIFPTTIGVVDHVNLKKGVLHVVAGRDLDGVIPASEVAAEVGDHLALRLARFSTRSGPRTRVVAAEKTDATASDSVCRTFRSRVRVNGEMGFTNDSIFIPPDLVRKHGVENDDLVSGLAAINFDKKKGIWGWKALRVDPVAEDRPTRLENEGP